MPSVDELAEIIEMDFGRGYSEEFKGKYFSGESGPVYLMRFLKNKDEQFKAEQERLDNEYSVEVDSIEVHDEKMRSLCKGFNRPSGTDKRWFFRHPARHPEKVC